MKLRERFLNPAQRPVRRGIYILPSLITTAGLFAAFYGIVAATQGHFERAAAAVFFAMLMDGLDGRVARITHTTSDFGVEYDSLVDMAAFGLAPAFIVYEWGLRHLGKFGWLAAFIYVAATALRLARFNTQRFVSKRYFQGLPSPSAAALVAATVWTLVTYGIEGRLAQSAALILTLAAALGMVSAVKYRSFKDLDIKGRVPFAASIALVLVFVLFAFDTPLVLFLLFLAYFLSGLVTSTVHVLRRWSRVRNLRALRDQAQVARDKPS